MKTILIVIATLISINALTQDAQQNNKDDKYTSITNFNTYGYINGIRLDSIQAIYAEFDFAGGNRIRFDYGQIVNKNNEYFVTNKQGKFVYLDKQSNAFLLNFFHYNHWDLYKAFAITTSGEWVLKKQIDATQ